MDSIIARIPLNRKQKIKFRLLAMQHPYSTSTELRYEVLTFWQRVYVWGIWALAGVTLLVVTLALLVLMLTW